jgi:hypothetical protein
MRIEQFRELLHRQPFLPFTIYMVDGRTFDVRHPDFVAVRPSGRSVILADDEGTSFLDAGLIAELRINDRDEHVA